MEAEGADPGDGVRAGDAKEPALPPEASARVDRSGRQQERLNSLLEELPPDEARELRGLLGELEVRPPQPFGPEGVPEDDPSESRVPLSPRAQRRITRALLGMSVLAFLLAIVFGWVAGRVLPVSLQVQQDWIQKGVFPDGSLVYTKGQTTDSRTNDPWGNPYRLVYRGSATWRIYSCGPDGRDELGSGDDIPMGRGVGWSLAVMAIYGDAMLGMLGLAFAWLAAGTRVLWLPRSRNPRVENARAIGLLTVPAFVSWLAARAFGMELIALLPQRFVLPGDMVLWGTIGAVLVVAFFVVKGWRRANLKLAQA